MNFNLSINGESAEELANLGAALSTLPATTKPEPKTEEPKLQAVEVEQPIKPEPKTRAKAAPKEEVKTEVPQEAAPITKSEPITIETVRALVQSKATAGKRDEVKALLNAFEVARVTDLDPAQYADFMLKAEAL